MKMRGIDPDKKLAEARASLAETEARIHTLESEREARLLEPEFLADVSRIDRELATLNAEVVIYREREAKMRQKQRERDHERRADAMKAALAELGMRLGRRVEIARRLDDALRVVEGEVKELLETDHAIFANWPEAFPPGTSFEYARASIIKDLSSRQQPRPLFAGFVKSIADHGGFDFAATIERLNQELISDLQAAATPVELDTEAA